MIPYLAFADRTGAAGRDRQAPAAELPGCPPAGASRTYRARPAVLAELITTEIGLLRLTGPVLERLAEA